MILFVCTGNTCRSPMAAAMARKMGLQAESAGLSAFPGMPATPQALRAAQRHGGDLAGHRARMVDAEMVKRADAVIAFWDGASRGTKSLIGYAKECGKALYIKRI